MTSPLARLYALAASLLVFFLAWAGIAARPWKTPAYSVAPAPAPGLALYEQRLRADAALLRQLSAQSAQPVAPPLVRVVTLPPLTTTRTS